MPRPRKASAKHAEISLSQPPTLADLIDIMGHELTVIVSIAITEISVITVS